MNNDKQIMHHLWWIVKLLPDIKPRKGATIKASNKKYAKFIDQPLSEEVCKEVNELVAYIKLNY